ncbi:MAG TPA: SGNH/GDSL hydrolase family protein [Planctomycetota bacterium]|nr:SGNH/GDSL hydrolase family protein [Planctomycetota bacterium]
MSARSVLKKLAVSFASLILILLAAEVVARLAEPGPFSFVDRQPYDRAPVMDHVHKRNFAGRWDGTWYATNSLGLRGAELHPKFTADEYRVLAVGDSCTFGKGVVDEDTWPRQLETLLKSALPPGKSTVVANAGVNGYSAKQYLEEIRQRVPVLKPDLIVVGYSLNDFPNETKALDENVHQGEGNLRAAIPNDMRNFLGRFAMFRWMRATYYVMNRERDFALAEAKALAVKNQGKRSADRVAREIGHLESMAKIASETGAQLCVFLFPYESQVYLEKYDTSAVDWLKKLCEERNIPFVEMVDAFRAIAHSKQPPKKLFIRGDRYHPDPEGYGIVAKRVLETVRDHGWLPKPQ